MIFDPVRMCWISTLPSDEEEPETPVIIYHHHSLSSLSILSSTCSVANLAYHPLLIENQRGSGGRTFLPSRIPLKLFVPSTSTVYFVLVSAHNQSIEVISICFAIEAMSCSQDRRQTEAA